MADFNYDRRKKFFKAETIFSLADIHFTSFNFGNCSVKCSVNFNPKSKEGKISD